ncbi:hypothetical protein PSEWESI4_04921 [Pseudomonas carbonaria]|uniref:Uncharacterized protein n=2 Tax=Zestomonas carbonaria TaxID=2762745 RepID=A0A7U7ESZ8_9GAMM|nr:hypothetical protein PSEWESI4_04921 [Pseudomonas carbonaria]
MMKKYFLAFKIATFLFLSPHAHASETITFIRGDLDSDKKNDEIKIFSIKNSEHYGLSITLSSGKRFENKDFIPGAQLVSKGDIQEFNGIAINNGAVNIFYNYCGPEYSICSNRTLIVAYKEESLDFIGQKVVSYSNGFTNSFYEATSPATPLTELTYESYLQRDQPAEQDFTRQFGNCIADLGLSALDDIADALQQETYPDWLTEKGCITTQLVSGMLTQGEIDTKNRPTLL